MDRLAKEALKTSLDRKKNELMSATNVVLIASHDKCHEIWENELEEKVLLISRTIIEEIPQEGWSYILERCIYELIDIITPVEAAGILLSMIYGKFKESERPVTPILVMGGGLSELLNNEVKDKDKTGMVA